MSNNSLPVIDMQDFPGQLDQLIKACDQWGCFRILNFDPILPRSLLLQMNEVVKSLLDLPTETKKRNVDAIAGSGYMAPSAINPLYEALGLYDMSSVKDVDNFCSNLDATPHQRDTITNYARAVNELMMEIGRKIGEGLGVKGCSFDDWSCQFRINKYSFNAEAVGSPGVQLHTDSSFITILQDDEQVGGLEVMKRCGTLVAVEPFPGSLLVNLGDIATVWSNGRFLNVKHKVMCKKAAIRFSIASFLLGPKEAAVEAPSELVDEEHPRLYKPFLYHEYRNVRMEHKLHTGSIDPFLL